MPKRVTNDVVQTNLLEHPAVKAWSELQPERVEPKRIEILEERRKKKRIKKSAVYRLEGVGPAGSAIIAKLCRKTTAMVERTIYEEVLPHLPVPTLRYYGFVDEPEGKLCWQFLEDAGEEEYSPLIEEHRVLAARWLGRMHTSASQVAAAASLPDRGPRHYLDRLQSACDTIRRNLANPALNADDQGVLESIISHCQGLESHWSQVESFCDGMPKTLVHSDFVRKNMRIRTGPAGTTLLPLDWGESGWGVPAVDLAQLRISPKEFSADPDIADFSGNPDITAYWSVVRDHWPTFDVRTIQQLTNIGTMFRCLARIHWKVWSLEYDECIEWGIMKRMRLHETTLADSMRAAEWSD